MRYLFISLVILSAIVSGLAQTKPVAHKFDEFTIEGERYGEARRDLLRFRAERIRKRMQIERGKQLILIGYRSRILDGENYSGKRVADNLRSAIGYSVLYDVESIDGGLREKDNIEVWIAPKNAEPPKPSSEYTAAEAIDCPSVAISSGPLDYVRRTIEFKVDTQQPELRKGLKWRPVGGEITDRGSDSITVKETNGPGSRVTVFLEVPEVPMPCTNRFTAEAFFRVEPVLVDQFGRVSNGEFRGQMDLFFFTLSNNPQDLGLIQNYGGRNGGGRDAAARQRLIMNHMRFRNFPADRIKIEIAGSREELETSLWRVVPGSESPTPKPTLDKRFVVNTP